MSDSYCVIIITYTPFSAKANLRTPAVPRWPTAHKMSHTLCQLRGKLLEPPFLIQWSNTHVQHVLSSFCDLPAKFSKTLCPCPNRVPRFRHLELTLSMMSKLVSTSKVGLLSVCGKHAKGNESLEVANRVMLASWLDKQTRSPCCMHMHVQGNKA